MRRIRMAMVGGGPRTFIGEAHRMAARLDGEIELVAGCFSRDAARNAATGRACFLDPGRVYASWEAMLAAEAARPDGADLIANVTGNELHVPVSLAALARGFHVICDKPLAWDVAEAERLVAALRGSDRVFALTHTYAGSAMVRQARALLRSGELGAVRKIVVEYANGSTAAALASGDAARIALATHPAKRTAVAGALADIGTHAEHLARFVTGLAPEAVCARTATWVPGRTVDADADVLVRWSGGATGVLIASQICAGEENPLRLRVWAERGGLEWAAMAPDTLTVRRPDRSIEVMRAGREMRADAAGAVRLPAGHVEGYLESFAYLYRTVARRIQALLAGRAPDPVDLDLPTAEDGLAGMRFLAACADSAAAGGAWVAVPGR